MTDPADQRATPARARRRRARRFVLPDTPHDERTAARIVAFLDGPAAAALGERISGPGSDRPRLPKELDTRQDWTAAFSHEASRHARYGRPVSVLLLEVAGTPVAASLDRVARAVADLIRDEARACDRAVRLGPSSFRLLLPETSARAARHVGTRLERGFQGVLTGLPDRFELRIEVAAPTRGGSLEDGLTDAERRLEARPEPGARAT